MAKAKQFAETHLRRAIDTGVRFLITDKIVVPTNKRTDDAKVRLKAGTECHGLILAKKPSKFRLKFQMKVKRTVEESRTRAPCPIFLQRPDSRLHNFRADRSPR